MRLREGCVLRAGRDSPPPARIGQGARALRGVSGHGLWGGAEALTHLTAPTPGLGGGLGMQAWPRARTLPHRPLQGLPGPGRLGREAGRAVPRYSSRPSPGARLGWNRDQPGPGALASAMFSCPTR